MGRNTPEDKHLVYLVDFGLAKEHLDMNTGEAHPQRKNTDFRGTIPYASLGAHFKKELGRKDDIWSFFFIILEFLDEPLSWKQITDKDQVRDLKQKAFQKPQKYLFPSLCKKFPQVQQIFDSIAKLKYPDKPDYAFVRAKLKEIECLATRLTQQRAEQQRDYIMQQSFNFMQQQQEQQL